MPVCEPIGVQRVRDDRTHLGEVLDLQPTARECLRPDPQAARDDARA